MINKKQILIAVAIFMWSTLALANAENMTQTGSTQTWSVETTTNTSVEVSWVDVVDAKTLSVEFSGKLDNGVSADSDVKIFKDMNVVSAEKDLNNAKKVKLTLWEDLDFGGYEYSLFSVSSIETSMDFALNSTSSGKVTNEADTWIESIDIVDAKTLEINLKDDKANITDFKLLKEVKIESMFYDSWALNVQTSSELHSNGNYFFMFVALKDNNGKEIEVTNSMYDFSTGELMTEEADSMSGTTSLMTASGAELSASWAELTGSGLPIEEVAKDVSVTPDTWAKTNILLALTFLLTIAFVVVRKKAFKI